MRLHPDRVGTQLPPPAEIDNEPIREALIAYNASTASLRDRQREVLALDGEREQALDADAQATAKARAAGKGGPRVRSHVAAFEKKAAEVDHELRVAQIASRDAWDTLQATYDTHQDEWVDAVRRRSSTSMQAFRAGVPALQTMAEHATRDAMLLHRLTSPDRPAPAIGAISVRPEQILGLEVAYNPDPTQRVKQRGLIRLDDVFDRLEHLGEPEPEPMLAGGDALEQGFQAAGEHARAVKAAHSTGYQQTGEDIADEPQPMVFEWDEELGERVMKVQS